MTIQEIQEEIINEFKTLDDNGLDRYNQLIKLGKKLPSIDSKYKTEKNLIKDCQVKTWYCSVFKKGKVFYNIESKSIIANGIIALLTKVLSGQKPEDIKNADLHFIDKICPLGLKKNQTNDLWNLINRMISDATLYEKKQIRDRVFKN